MNVLKETTHKAKTITIVELCGMKTPQAIQMLNDAQKEIALMPPKSALLITDVTDTEISNEFISAVMEFAKKNTPNVKASASVGGGNKIVNLISFNVASSAGRKINSFNTRLEAMDWLVSQP